MTAYTSSLYSASLSEFGRPHYMPRCGGWLIERAIPGADAADAAGGYPFFCCENWSRLGRDLDDAAGRLVAVSMVADPYCGATTSALSQIFPDVCRPYKEHYVVDLAANWRHSICSHHRRNVRTAATKVEVEWCDRPYQWIDAWSELYAQLVLRHSIRGLARFSHVSFMCQLQAPDISAFRAVRKGRAVGMLLWCRMGDVAVYHLGAFDAEGYRCKAAFALFDAALGHFAAGGIRFAGLGGAAGWDTSSSDGLTRFKRGWANDRRTAWFCGRIFDRGLYDRLAWNEESRSGYFPIYRQAEAA